MRRGEVTVGKRRIRSRKKIIKNTKYGRKRGDLLNGGRSHVPLGKRGRNREGKRKKSQVSAGVGGVEVLGVLVAGRGAGIQGNGLFLIIQTPPLYIYTQTEEAPTWPHDNSILTHLHKKTHKDTFLKNTTMGVWYIHFGWDENAL